MAHRQFQQVHEHLPGRGRTSRYRVVCGACGVTDALSPLSIGDDLARELVPRKFRERGWEIGRRDVDDRCPGCVAKEEAKRRSKVVKLVEAAPSVDAPREMQREDRRIILAKLNDIYLDEQRGYDNGWSDHRVAEDLGVPRKWVETLREENFGPAGDNEGLRKFAADVKALVADLAAFSARADELTKLGNALADDAKRTRDALRPLERQVAAIAKMTGAAA